MTLSLFLWVGFLLYLQTFRHDWSFDDFTVIVTNPDIRSFSNFWLDAYPGRPLRELSFLVDYAIFSFEPVGWHIQNVLWHSLNAWLVFLLGRELTGNRAVAWISGLLFLVHPVHVEVVAQISHRKDSLALFFVLLAFFSYRKTWPGRWGRFVGILFVSICVLLGGLAKINAVMILPALLVFESVCRKKFPSKYLLVILAVAAVIAALVYPLDEFREKSTFLLTRNGTTGDYGIVAYLLTVIKSWAFLFAKLIVPVGLSVNYIITTPETWLDPWVIAAALLLVVMATGLVMTRKHHPVVCFCLAWILLFYLPTANLWPITWFAADRYLYAPSVGFCLLVGILLVGAVQQRSVLKVTTVCMIFYLALLSFRQTETWQDNATLWTHAQRVNPTSAQATMNVALHLHADDARRQLNLLLKAKELNPRYSFVHYHLGKYYERQGEDRLAIENYREFFRLYHPRYEQNERFWVEQLREHVWMNFGLRL